MREKKCVEDFDGETRRKVPIASTICRWDCNIKMDFKNKARILD
jgi:hypothetical protein